MNTSRPRLLYLEDEVFLALGVERSLSQDAGFDVHLVHSLSAAEREWPRDPVDIALLDINLSASETSIGLAGRMMLSGVPVVLTSGLSAIPDGLPSHGPVPMLIEKPFDLNRIGAILIAALAGAGRGLDVSAIT